MSKLFTWIQTHRLQTIAFACLLFWMLAHIPGLLYGADKPPLHVTYVGDEQVSVNSALRVLNEKSITAFRNREMQYYGPMFVVLDMPGVVADFVWKYASGVVDSAESYKKYIIWDWGGILLNIRLTALLSMAFGLGVLYKLASTVTFNPSGSRYLPYLAPVLVGVNYFYFQYSHFAIHWVYIIPCLFLQVYTLVRIMETKGERRIYWIVHGVATAVSFGVSYFSVIFLSMWVPVLFQMWKERNGALFIKFLTLSLSIGASLALIVWWHPYAFFRILSFMGIGDPMHNIGDAQNPFVVSDASFGFYLTQLVVNQLPLVLAFFALVFLLWRVQILRSHILWIILLPGIFNFLLFAPASHHEGRYNLPTLLSLILACAYMYALYRARSENAKSHTHTALATLFSVYVVFHVVHVGLWMHIFAQGPLEYEAIQKALELQETGAPVLVVNSYLFGYPHTKDSYRAFAEHRNFGDIPLYKEIYANPLPEDRVPLDARYMFLRDFENDYSVMDEYPHVLLHVVPRAGEWNQFTYFDENILRNWFYRELSSSYVVIK